MLNEEQIRGKWTEIKGGVRNLWGRISDDEIEKAQGSLSAIARMVQERYGESKEEIKSKLESLMNSFDNDTDKNLTPSESSFERNPTKVRTAERSEYQDNSQDKKTKSPERNVFDKEVAEEHKAEDKRTMALDHSEAGSDEEGSTAIRDGSTIRYFDNSANENSTKH